MLEPPGSIVAFLSVPDRASYAITKRAKKPAARNMSHRTRKKLAPGDGKIKLMDPLASSRLAKPASSSQSKSPSVSRIKGARCLRSTSPALCLGDVNDDGALIIISNRNESAGEASLRHV